MLPDGTMVIDAQIHAWKETPEYPTPEAMAANHGRDYTIERALVQMDATGVDRCILVPPGSWSTGKSKNAYSLAAAEKYPQRFAVMGQFDLEAPDANEQLANWIRPGMLGIRMWLGHADSPPVLTDRSYDWFWSGLERYSIPFMSAAPGRMQQYADVLNRFPDLKLVIDHCARAPYGPKDDAAWEDLDETLALAAFPRTSIKVSSLPAFSSSPYPFPSLHTPIRRIYDAFGPERMLWGSDVTRLGWPYADNLKLFTHALTFLSDEDRSWILGRAAAKHCGWAI